MNKLEEYKKDLSEKLWDDNHPTEQRAVRQGFDAAIALDLPVKFKNWIDGKVHNDDRGYYLDATDEFIANNNQELYQYWLDNVLKLE